MRDVSLVSTEAPVKQMRSVAIAVERERKVVMTATRRPVMVAVPHALLKLDTLALVDPPRLRIPALKVWELPYLILLAGALTNDLCCHRPCLWQ